MKLKRIRLEDYRGIDRNEVELLETGVTIVQGPNEIGKSCLAEAIDILFDYPDGSSNRRVKALKPTHRDAGPAIEVEMEIGGFEMTYRKRYLRNRETLLTIGAPRGESLTGREAHDRVKHILSEHLDVPLWRALRVQQGAKIEQAEMAEALSLGAALDRVAGAAPVGDAEVAILDLARAEYRRYFTESGRDGSVLGSVRFALEEARAEVDKWSAELDAIEADIERSARLAREIETLGRRRADAEETLRARDAQWQAVLTLTDRVRSLHDEWRVASSVASAARDRSVARRQLIDLVDQAGRERDELRTQIAAAAPSLEALVQQHARAKEELAAARRVHAATQRSLQACERDFELRRDELDLQLLQERRTRIAAARAELVEAAAVVETSHVDQVLLERIRKNHLAVERARASLDAGSPSVRIAALARVTVAVDDEAAALAPGATIGRTVSERTTVTIPGVVEVEVAAGKSMETLSGACERAEAELREALDEGRVETAEEAETSHERRKDAERALAQARKALKADLRDLDVDEVDARIAGLDARISAYRRSRGAGAIPETLDGARAARDEVRARLRPVTEAAEAAEAAAEAARRALDAAEAATRDLTVRHAAAERTLDHYAEQLAAGRAGRPDVDLDGALASSEAAEHRAQTAHDGAAAALAAQDPDTARELAEGAERALAGLADQLTTAVDERRELEAVLTVRGEEGLYDKLGAARERLRRAEEEHDHLCRRAEAARLLYQTLASHREAATRAYVGPLREQITKLARIVFGESCQIELGDDLRIVARTLAGRTVPFESLSVGAREQLSLIGRLAGSILVARDGGVPVIFDDSLGYSDEVRLDAMGAILGLAGRTCQVVILTCVPDRYRQVGGARIVRLGGSGPDLAAAS
ncbi:MAG: AAA family ATPase [Actinomycetota bacterium]